MNRVLKKMTIGIVLLLIIISLDSCKTYNSKQQKLLNKIAKQYRVGMDPEIRSNFTRKEIITLTNHKNPLVRASFFKMLLAWYPQECYNVILDHLNDTKTVEVVTSYDTIGQMSVSEYMLWATQISEFIDKEQRERLNDLIVFNYRIYPHLNGEAYLILRYHSRTDRYYNFVRNLVVEKKDRFNNDEIFLLYYIAKFRKSEDVAIINPILQMISKKDSSAWDDYSFLELIRKYPDNEYYSILRRIYEEKIENREFRCDDCYCELEQYIITLIVYPNPETIVILSGLIKSNNYNSSCKQVANKEQIYHLLKKSKNAMYQPLLKSLEKEIDMAVYNEIVQNEVKVRDI